LLLFNAVFTVPVARAATNRVSRCAVYCERKKLRKNRAEQLSAPAESTRPAPPVLFAGRPRTRAAVPILDSSLFQRPPPALS
jgi:hypothetical protein